MKRTLARRLPLCLLIACSCAAPRPAGSSASRAAAGAGVVSLAALPEPHRELWEAWLAAAVPARGGQGVTGRALWEQARLAALEDQALCAFLIDNLLRQMVRAWDRSQLVSHGHLPGPFERARAELVRLDFRAVPVLAELLAMADGSVALLAADTLAGIGQASMAGTLALLERDGDEARRRSADLLGRLPAAPRLADEVSVITALGRRLLQDAAWVVRAQAARSLGLRGARLVERGAARSVLIRGLEDAELPVRRECAKALGVLGDPRAIPHLIDSLERSVAAGQPGELPSIRSALAALSGGEDLRSLAAWRRWWGEEGAQRVRASER